MAEYRSGSIVKCQVTGIEKYGAFVNIDSNYTGLIHISEISQGFVKDINDYVKIGDTIYCQILEVDEDNLQLKLSIKNINYKTLDKNKNIKESRRGFLPLKNNLPIWIKEKINEYQE